MAHKPTHYVLQHQDGRYLIAGAKGEPRRFSTYQAAFNSRPAMGWRVIEREG